MPKWINRKTVALVLLSLVLISAINLDKIRSLLRDAALSRQLPKMSSGERATMVAHLENVIRPEPTQSVPSSSLREGHSNNASPESLAPQAKKEVSQCCENWNAFNRALADSMGKPVDESFFKGFTTHCDLTLYRQYRIKKLKRSIDLLREGRDVEAWKYLMDQEEIGRLPRLQAYDSLKDLLSRIKTSPDVSANTKAASAKAVLSHLRTLAETADTYIDLRIGVTLSKEVAALLSASPAISHKIQAFEAANEELRTQDQAQKDRRVALENELKAKVGDRASMSAEEADKLFREHPKFLGIFGSFQVEAFGGEVLRKTYLIPIVEELSRLIN